MKSTVAAHLLVAVAMTSFSANAGVAPAPDSLTRALWHLDEEGGTVIGDASGFGNNGFAHGTTVVDGRFGAARYFNGSGDGVFVDPDPALNVDTSGFTLELWFKTTGTQGVIVRKGLAPAPGYMISLLYGHVVGMIGNTIGSVFPDTLLSDTSRATYNDDQWHHVVLVRDRSVRELRLYVDDTLAAPPARDPITFSLSSDRPFTMGQWENFTQPGYFTGAIDEVRLSCTSPVRPPVAFLSRPSGLDFGTLPIGGSTCLELEVSNPGYRDSLIITSLTATNRHFTLNTESLSLPPFGSATILVTYAPSAPGLDTGAIVGVSPQLPPAELRIPVRGEGLSAKYSVTRALWHLDEQQGSMAQDASGFNNDGVATGTSIVNGRFGKARYFNGHGDGIFVPSSTTLDLDTSNFTLDVWFQSLGNEGVLVRRGLAPSPGFMVSLSSGRVVGMIGGAAGTTLLIQSDTAFNDGFWHLASLVRDRPSRELRLYVDLSLAAAPVKDTLGFSLSSDRPLTMGRWENSIQPSFFTGAIDEVQLSSANLIRMPVMARSDVSSLNFGGVKVGKSDTVLVRITNPGYQDTLRLMSIATTNSRFAAGTSSMIVPPFGAKYLALVFSPATAGADTGTVTAVSNDPQAGTLRITLSGTGQPTNAIPEGSGPAPREFTLEACFPNPFNPTTTITFGVPRAGNVELTVFNILGQKVRTLVNGLVAAGTYRVRWDAKDDRGLPVCSGVYLYRMKGAAGFLTTRKMLLIR